MQQIQSLILKDGSLSQLFVGNYLLLIYNDIKQNFLGKKTTPKINLLKIMILKMNSIRDVFINGIIYYKFESFIFIFDLT